MRSENKLALAVGALLLGTIVYFPDPALGVNGAAHFAQTYMIVHHHTLAIDPFVEQDYTCDWARAPGGHYYPAKAPGLSFLAVPFLMGTVSVELLAGRDAAAMPVTNAYVTNLFVNALLGAVAAALLLRTLLALSVPSRPAIVATLGVTLGSAYFPYAAALHYSHTCSAALSVIAAALAFRGARSQPAGLRDLALAGFVAGLATFTEYACALLVLILAVYLWVRTKDARALAAYAAGGLPVAIAFALYHWSCFGSPFALAYHFMNPIFEDAGSSRLAIPDPWALLAVSVLPYRGVFFYSPILLVALLGIPGARRAHALPEALAGGAFFALLLVETASFRGWHAGDTTGPRYLVTATPLAAPLIAFGVLRAPRAALALFALSVANYLAITFVSWDLPQTERYPLSLVYANLVHGGHARDNLGTLVGLPGLVSLVPLVVALGASAFALVRATRMTSQE